MAPMDFCGYLSLLREVKETLTSLTEVEQEKIRAVQADDLDALNACMKQEQVLSLALRGYDQKRELAMTGLRLKGVPLSGLVDRAPEPLRLETKELVEEMQRQYQLFQGAAEVARNTLECNLHQIEKVLHQMGAQESDGYGKPEPELPRSMRTDLRA